MTAPLKMTVTVELAPIVVLVLDAIAAHVGKDRSETVADALHVYFVLLLRPDDPPVAKA